MVFQTIRKSKIFSCVLDRASISKLPYLGPVSKRLYLITQNTKKDHVDEIFIQRRDAFTTNLLYAIKRLENHEISEIRYSFGVTNLIRIFLNEDGDVIGEYYSESQNAFEDFKRE